MTERSQNIYCPSQYALRRRSPRRVIGGVYPNATLNTSTPLLLVEFGWYYEIGVRPGDTVYDMTGRHQFTIPADDILDEGGYKRVGSSGITIANSTDFDRVSTAPGTFWGGIWNPKNEANGVHPGGYIMACWSSPNFDFIVGRNQGGLFDVRQNNYAADHQWTHMTGDQDYMLWHQYDDKIRYYCTGAAYSIEADGPLLSRTTLADMTISNSLGRTRCVFMSTGDFPHSPGATGAGAVPAYVNAFGANHFNPITGVWS